jgi:hypothetical protein
MGDKAMRDTMSTAAKAFSRPEAARKIATSIIETALTHEPV